LSHPHDEFLDAWLSTGIVGLGAFLWLQVVFWRLVLRTWRQLLSTSRRLLVLGAAGAMLAGLLHGLVDNGYFLMDLSILFWLLCGLVQYCAETDPKTDGVA
jgi:O-antigen ligase